jgi:hypothetical protein
MVLFIEKNRKFLVESLRSKEYLDGNRKGQRKSKPTRSFKLLMSGRSPLILLKASPTR